MKSPQSAILILASQSASRQMLLRQSGIPFKTVGQSADESACDWGLPLAELVASIARHKMNHVLLPNGKDGDVCFVLTADTLSQDPEGRPQGKPTSREDAIEKIKIARQGARLSTGFCLDRKIWRDNAWHIEQRIERVVSADYMFIVPDEWIDTYLDNSPGLACANAIAIEEYGNLFLQSINGSYSTIVGLPIFELREALEELGFFHAT